MTVADPHQDPFSMPISTLRGIAGRRAEALERLGVESLGSLLCLFPRDYEDWSDPKPISGLVDGEDAAFLAEVSREPSLRRKGRMSLVRTVLRDATGAVSAVWFNQPYQQSRLKKGERYLFRGRIKRRDMAFEVANPSFEEVPEEGGAGLKSIYPMTRNLSQGVVRSAVHEALERCAGILPEPLPVPVRMDHRLAAVDYAYQRIHEPTSREDVGIARQRLVFEELFLMQAGLRLLKTQTARVRAARPIPAETGLNGLLERLPFQLTEAQQRVFLEISHDMERNVPMNRLVQGDVGCGKTVLAALAMHQAYQSGLQSALMAPTAILAEQHKATLDRLIGGDGLRMELLTSATTAARRRSILEGIASGEVHMVIGTHALLETDIRFHALGLAVTDEQHRFGVRQRATLSTTEGNVPHVLVMSATPIPRTLALILYGDLDISIVDGMPAGRIPIETYTALESDRARIHAFLRRQVEEGHQIYVVCPMVEENEEQDLASAMATFERLSKEVFPDLPVALVHGRMKAKEKTDTMAAFQRGDSRILVATTVIEVGVDHPEATVMVVENADRFGLAQLHQLRGRIGRSTHRSVCILMAQDASETAMERLRTLCRTHDGFVVAEKDLQLRGPGQFFGTRQHGLPEFRIADLYRDLAVLKEVQGALDRLLKDDPLLEAPENRCVVPGIRSRFGMLFPNIGI
jgi:ATP-dependent DNA helicase RecG